MSSVPPSSKAAPSDPDRPASAEYSGEDSDLEPLTLEVELTSEPWTLDVDALVIPVGQTGELGDLGAAVIPALASRGLAVEGLVPTGTITPDDPQLMIIPPGQGTDLPRIRALVYATAWDASVGQSTPDAAARAASVAVWKAATDPAAGVHRLGLPLIGCGAAGVAATDAIEVIVDAVRARLGGVAGAAGLEAVVFFDRDPITVEQLQEIVDVWAPYPPQDDIVLPPHLRRPVPHMDGDGATGEDRLGIESEVATLAAVVASKVLTPPMCIGLLGDWGTGKTFFMQKMRDAVGRLGEQSALAEAQTPKRESNYCSQISQITFNAWHYSDDELWPSLAAHIFQNLAGDDDAELEVAAQRADTSEQRYFDELAELQLTLRQLKARQTELKHTSNDLSDLWALFHSGSFTQAASEVGKSEAVMHVRHDLGLNDAAVDDVRGMADDATKAGASFRAAFRLIRRTGGQGTLRLLLGAAVVLLLLAAAFWFRLPEQWPTWISGIGSVIALIATWIVSLRPAMQKVREAAETVRDVLTELDAQEEQQRADLEKRRAELQNKIDAQRKVLQEKRELYSGGAKLQQFLKDRDPGSYYREKFGTVARLREDFAQLQRILEQDQTGSHRIVLYIDDLDRCPRELVVKMLEATHLLLASELFVVIVAVDPRWLLSSLEAHHHEQLGQRQNGSDPYRRSTALNYLEKIFQIPYALCAVEPGGFVPLVDSLLPEAVDDNGWWRSRPPAVDPGPAATVDLSGDDKGEDGEPLLDLRESAPPGVGEPQAAEGHELSALQLTEALKNTRATIGARTSELELLAARRNAPLQNVLMEFDLDSRFSQQELDRLAGWFRTSTLTLRDVDRALVGRTREESRSLVPRVLRLPFALPSLSDRRNYRLAASIRDVVDPKLDEMREAIAGEREQAINELRALERQAQDLAIHEGALDLVPLSLQLTSDERRFLGRASTMVGTPRSVKRLVNVYRLIRAQESDRLPEPLGEPDDPGPYEAVITWLAILVGYPEQADLIFQAAHRDSNEDPLTIGGESGNWRPNNNNCNGLIAEQLSPSDLHTWKQLCDQVDKLATGATATQEIDRDWIGYLARFSFRTVALFDARVQ